jgi:O-antigen/teichoic acid export membrane protein
MGTETGNQTFKSKRIASNSILLFLRMLAITVINLFAVRLLLHNLGQEDYGTFNAVAGVVLASTFINTTLAVSIQRFYSYTLGEGRRERLIEIFSACMNIILGLSVVLLIIFETAGLWFVNTQLGISHDRLVAANWVFQCSLITLWLGLIQLPFVAAIFAQEEMGAFALISLTECLLRLGVVILIGITVIDGLICYSVGLCAVAIIILLLYMLIVRHRYPDYRYSRKIPSETYKSLLTFSGWTMYSAMAAVGLTQGITILLYMFFGPIATASYAISQQVLHAFTALSNSIVVAFRPAMVKSYAEKNYEFLDNMFSANNKLILYLLMVVAIPLTLELRTIFGWWLDDVSNEAVVYTRLIIIYMVCFSMHNPVTTIVQAAGQLKYYSLLVDSVVLLCLPATWMAFQLGATSEAGIILMIATCLVAHIIRLIILRCQYPPFNYMHYLTTVVLPGLLVSAGTVSVAFIIHQSLHPGFLRLVSVFITAGLTLFPLVYTIGLSRTERQTLRNFIKERIIK